MSAQWIVATDMVVTAGRFPPALRPRYVSRSALPRGPAVPVLARLTITAEAAIILVRVPENYKKTIMAEVMVTATVAVLPKGTAGATVTTGRESGSDNTGHSRCGGNGNLHLRQKLTATVPATSTITVKIAGAATVTVKTMAAVTVTVR